MFPSLSPRQRIASEIWARYSKRPVFPLSLSCPAKSLFAGYFRVHRYFSIPSLWDFICQINVLSKVQWHKERYQSWRGVWRDWRNYDAHSNEREICEASVKFDQIARGLIRYNFTKLCALIFLTHLALIPASWLFRESQHNLSLKQKRTRITSKGIPLTSLVGLMLYTSQIEA